MAKNKIKFNTDQRPFSMTYHDSIDSNILESIYQLALFIALKRFSGENNKCFPSLKKLAKVSRMSQRKVQETLKELEEKHIISIENRLRTDGGDTSNLYTLHDYKELWNPNNSKEVTTVINEIEEQQMIKALTAKGYYISKEKGLVSDSSQTTDTRPQKKYDVYNKQNTTSKIESQDLERYTLDQIHELFDYDIMVLDYPLQQNDINSVMSILYTAMNTTKSTIRIAGEDKPAMVVIGKLMKLHKESIMYAIKQFSEQTERIKNPTAYMLTILYNAPEQFNLDIQNRVSHDMASWNRLDE